MHKAIDLIQDVQPSDNPIRVYTNGGFQDYSKQGMLTLFDFEIFYNSSSLANILSLSEVAAKYRITMDTDASPSIRVHLDYDHVVIFEQCGSGLYFYDTANTDNTKHLVSKYSFLSTVASNKQYFTRREIDQADKAHILQAHIGWPATEDFKRIVSKNLLLNCDVTVDDISRAVAIYGQSEPMLKGKMVRRRPEHVADIPRVALPPMITEHHASDILDMDFFFMNGLGFLYTKKKTTSSKLCNVCTAAVTRKLPVI